SWFPLFGINVFLCHCLFDQGHFILAVENIKIFVYVYFLVMLSQDANPKCMEGTNGWNRGVRGEHCDHSFSHFTGCLVSKGDGKNIFWSSPLMDQMKNTMG